MLNNKTIDAVCTHVPGKMLTRTFNLGMAGTKTEAISLDGQWMRHPNRPEKDNVRGKAIMEDKERKCWMLFQKCHDEALQHPRRPHKCMVNCFELSDDGYTMYCSEFLADPSDYKNPIGPVNSYEMHKKR